MIRLIGNAPRSTKYVVDFFSNFLSWVRGQKLYQLDIETNMTPWWCDKKLITVQFGDLFGKQQWVLQWSVLTPDQKKQVKEVLEDSTKTKLIHNATFEYVVLRFHDIIIENVYDTMNIEKVLLGGIMPKQNEPGTYGLADLSLKYLNYEMDKTEQTTFGDDVLTESKVVYAAQDVVPLGFIRRMQIDQLKNERLENVAALENEAVLAYGDVTFNGMELDIPMWLSNLELVGPLVEQSARACDALVLEHDGLRDKAIELGYLSDEDQIKVNWNSPKHKEELYQWVLPNIPGSSKALLNKWLKDLGYTKKTHTVLQRIPFAFKRIVDDNDFSELQKILLERHRDKLVDLGYVIPAGTVTINWNSVPQVLPLLKVLNPKVNSMDKESIDRHGNHRLFIDVIEYKQNLKLGSSYGQAFIDQHVEPDGKVRTNFNQVLTTGRTSSYNPNMQNIPAKESVGNRYRNAFKAMEGFSFVDSDYNSQELVVIAFLSQDPVWMKALREGKDLHSVCAELVYGLKWLQAADAGCAYYAKGPDGQIGQNKCNCKKHKTLRNGVKTINFGLAYGMSAFKLAATLNITVKEAESLIVDYFRAFPKIGSILNYLGRFGVTNGYIQTIAPFFRKRYYPEWKGIPEYIIEAHVSGTEYNPTLGKIERASKNQPIQGTSADIAKLSMVLIRWFIRDNNMWKLIYLVAQVHDQDTTIAHNSVAEKWKVKMTKLMEQAAFFIIPNGLLTSDTNITARWSK